MKGKFLVKKQKRGIYIILILISLMLTLPEAAFAYVDPGIGGMLFQVAYIIFTSFIVMVTFWLKPIKKLYHRIIKLIKKTKKSK